MKAFLPCATHRLLIPTAVGFLIADQQDGPFRLEIGWVQASPATL
jgi:hypothetical protein